MSFQRRKILRVLRDRDFVIIREGKNHTILKDDDGNLAILPRHTRINRLTARSIATSAKIPWAKFIREVR